MSRYLGRVLARSSGRPLGQMQAAPPMRWPGAGGDPGGAPDGAEEAAPGSDSPDRATPPPETAGASSARRRDGPDRDPSVSELRPVGSRSDAGPIEGQPSARGRSDQPGGRERVRVVRVGRDAAPTTSGAPPRPPDAIAPRSAAADAPRTSPPGTRPEPADSKGRSRARSEERPDAPVISPPPAPPAIPSPPDDRPASSQTSRGQEPATLVIAAPHDHAVQPHEQARPEVVIGRVSVVVEAPRLPPPAAPAAPRAAAPASRTADDGPGLAHRFGLGQL
jgi:hypothetical protein